MAQRRGGQAPALRFLKVSLIFRRAVACPSPGHRAREHSRGTGPRATFPHHPGRAESPDPALFGLWRARTTAVGPMPV